MPEAPTQLDRARAARGVRRGGHPRRVAMVSMHTSPLAQAGTGDAGGMNVYIVELARRLARANVEVDIFTRATASGQPPSVEAWPGVTVRHVPAGPFEGLAKDELPSQLCAFARGVLRIEADHPRGWYDLVHSHYWLSGQVATLAKDRWGVPLVHSMHTMAKVKNAALAAGDRPEPRARVIGEEQVVEYADRLVANTAAEAEQLRTLYSASPDQVAVVHPGVDLDVFGPVGELGQLAARQRLDLPSEAAVVVFVGRIQPLKAPDVLVRAIARLLAAQPQLRERLVFAVVGGPSGSGLVAPGALADLARELGVADVIRFVPPVPQSELADWYHAATVVGVPSHSESFGLVALEAQACGTPVIAASTGGLLTAVRDGVTGRLVDGHGSQAWADALAKVLIDRDTRARYAAAGAQHARHFGWDATVDRLLEVYSEVLLDRPEALSG